jgi:hypothetical protein
LEPWNLGTYMEMLDHVYSTSTHPWMHLRAGPFAFSYTRD